MWTKLRRALVFVGALERRFAIGLLLVIALNVYLRLFLEQPDKYLYNFMIRWVLPNLQADPSAIEWWHLLLPLSTNTISYHPLGTIALFYLPSAFGPVATWVSLYVVLVVVSFVLSLRAFGSRLFSYTFALCMAFGTQLYHAFNNSAIIVYPLYICMLQVVLFLGWRLARSEKPARAQKLIFALSLLASFSLSGVWTLDLAVYLIVASAVLAVWYARTNSTTAASAGFIGLCALGLGAAYLLVAYSFKAQTAIGGEEDAVWHYPELLPMLEDFVSNVFTITYLTISNFLPPALVGSNTQYFIGSEKIVEYQSGYHAHMSYLVPQQHIFLWRFYSGALVAGLLYALARFLLASFKTKNVTYLIVALLLLMILLGGTGHWFFKARPYLSAPVLSYKVIIGVMGLSLLISYSLTLLRRAAPSKLAVPIIIIVLLAIVSSSLTRPPYIDFLSDQVSVDFGGRGPYPFDTLLEHLTRLARRMTSLAQRP